jgi:phosphatidate phosphatase APP1
MDDTIKDTNIRNPDEAKANTLWRPFRPVAGMPERYRAWQAAGGASVHFHMVSAGPWQLHEPLRRFTEAAGFPDFTWDMRAVDVMNPAILIDETVKADPRRLYEFKVRAIRALITRLPQRRYVLVGDSGEKDPEVYATVLAQFPGHVAAIYIRDVTGEGRDAPRYQSLYAQPAAGAKLTVFTRPDELPERLDFEPPK